MIPAKADDLSLPENFFRSNGIKSRQFVQLVDLCPRVKGTKHVYLINQWQGTSVLPEPSPSPTPEEQQEQVSTAKAKKGKAAKKIKKPKKKKVRKNKRDPKVKSQAELESAISQLLYEKTIDTIVVENCAYTWVEKFKKRATVICEDQVTNRFDFLIASLKKAETEKPVLAVYEEDYSDEIMKRLETEKWNCEVYEPKAFKVKKVKRKPHAKELEIDGGED